MVFVCTTAGSVFGLDIESGREVCQIGLSAEIYSSPAVFEDCVLVGCRDDKLHCLHFELSS